jgi:hypothetical protein
MSPPVPSTHRGITHARRMQQDSGTDARAAHWQRRFCTAAVSIARGAGGMVSHSVHAALPTSSQKAPASPAAAGRSMDHGPV